MNLITLESDEISIECDVDRGADILSFVDKRINLNLLLIIIKIVILYVF